MKTVSGTLIGVDRSLAATGTEEPVDLGRVDADVCVRYLLGLPEPEGDAGGGHPPALTLRGRSGMWLTLVRKDPGGILRLSMRDGEEDHRIDEIHAARRVRLFVEHWGEETHLTEKIRLPPEVLARIAARDVAIDEERRRRTAEGPSRVAFSKRRGLLRRRHELAVDREAGAVTLRAGGHVETLADVAEIRRHRRAAGR